MSNDHPALIAALAEQANGDPDGVEVSTIRMTDTDLEAVADAYDEILRRNRGLSAGLRTWYTQLAEGARSTLHWRRQQERALQRELGLGSCWHDAVDALLTADVENDEEQET